MLDYLNKRKLEKHLIKIIEGVKHFDSLKVLNQNNFHPIKNKIRVRI